MTDERVTVITSIINRNNSGLRVTERRVTEYLAKKPYLKGLDNDSFAQAFIADEAELKAAMEAAMEVGYQKGFQHG